MNVILYTYDNPNSYEPPHAKSYRVFTALYEMERTPMLIVGAPWRKIEGRRSRHKYPAYDLAPFMTKWYDLPYLRIAHNDPLLAAFVATIPHALGIVGGARILPGTLIDAHAIGILNLHPGLLPENRGLDAMVHAVHRDVPQGATAHLIDHRVDAGRVVVRRELELYKYDSPATVARRLAALEVDVLKEALVEIARGSRGWPIHEASAPNKAGCPEVDRVFEVGWKDYLNKWAT